MMETLKELTPGISHIAKAFGFTFTVRPWPILEKDGKSIELAPATILEKHHSNRLNMWLRDLMMET